MARYILIDSNSGYIFGDTADFNGRSYSAGTPADAAREMDRIFQQIPDRGYIEHSTPPRDNRTGYHVYRADVNGSEAVATVTDGQDQEMIDAIESVCEYVCFVECISPSQQLENLFKVLTTCPKCNSKVSFGDPICEVCGEELTEFGKN